MATILFRLQSAQLGSSGRPPQAVVISLGLKYKVPNARAIQKVVVIVGITAALILGNISIVLKEINTEFLQKGMTTTKDLDPASDVLARADNGTGKIVAHLLSMAVLRCARSIYRFHYLPHTF